MGKIRSKMTPIQVQMLVDILFENSEIAIGNLCPGFSREERNNKWEAVATLLNSKGLGPQKTAEQWRKSWADLKCAIRSKATKIELDGGTWELNDKLSNLEKRVLQLSGDIRVDKLESSSENKKLRLKELEADLAKTEEDLMKALKKPNQIPLPYSNSKIFQLPAEMQDKSLIVDSTGDEEKTDNPSNEASNDEDDNIEVKFESYAEVNNCSDDEIIISDGDDNSDINEETFDDSDTKALVITTPPPKRRKVSSVDNASSSDTSSSESKSFISVFQRQIETQTAVLQVQTNIMKDIAKSLKIIANSLHGS